MFPIPWNFPFRKKNGDISTISDVINGGGGGGGSDLPPHSASDAGKLLGVDSEGTLEWTNEVSAEIQALTKYANAQSNRNLLDNPWFTVNQRGFSTSVNNRYGYDRWIGVYQYSSNGVLLSASQYLIQIFEDVFKNFINNKVITASVLFSDETIDSGSVVYKKTSDSPLQIINSSIVNVQIDTYGNFTMTAMPSIVSDITIKAVKLELGSVSTLHMDTAPNYAEELLKCQRYFFRRKGASVVPAYFNSTTNARSTITLPVPMRAIPSLSFDNVDYSQCGIYTVSGTAITPTAIAVDTVNSVVGMNELIINSTVDGGTANQIASQRFNLAMNFSADL